MRDIAAAARGNAHDAGGGKWTYGSKGAFCLYSDGHYCDWSADGPTKRGQGALEQISHLHPDVDPVEFARAWLASHPGSGNFVPRADRSESDADDVGRIAFINSLYNGASPIADTPARQYITQKRGLPLSPEAEASLRIIPVYRGDEAALVAAYTDNDGKLVAINVTYVTLNGEKSPHIPARQTFRGPRAWVRRGLIRIGKLNATAIEIEGLEKGLAAVAAGYEYVVITGGVDRIGMAELPPEVKKVIIVRDADPPGSDSDKALWRGVVRRLGQGMEVAVTARPNEIAPKEAPFLKDLDDVYRFDPELVTILLKSANLVHGRLGEDVNKAIYDEASKLPPGQLSRARDGIAKLLEVSKGALDDEIAACIDTRRAKLEGEEKNAAAADATWPDPVPDLGSVLDDAIRIAKRCVAAPDTHFDTMALWSVHAHLLHREELGVDVTPRLAFQSPEEDSGKSTFLKIVRLLVPRPKGVGSLTGSSLFRAIAARKVTPLVDEADYIFHSNANPDLLAIFNSSNERTFAWVSRSIPIGNGQFEDYDFCTYTALAFTSIHKLPIKSMQSRCIGLPMKPATKEEASKLIRFRATRCPELRECGLKIARWAADVTRAPRHRCLQRNSLTAWPTIGEACFKSLNCSGGHGQLERAPRRGRTSKTARKVEQRAGERADF